MQKTTIEIPFRAPYIKIGSAATSTKNIWMVFHGYGQLAEEFARSFSGLFTDLNSVIFPQALSKFYLKGVGQNIGASWMTAHDRDLDVHNYLNYLDSIFSKEVDPYLKHAKLNLLGFSQGGHTVSRWINHSKIKYNKLILWGTSLAHEIERQSVSDSFSKGENLVVIGDSDRFITKEQLLKVKKRYSKIRFNYKLITFRGGHEINSEVLDQII